MTILKDARIHANWTDCFFRRLVYFRALGRGTSNLCLGISSSAVRISLHSHGGKFAAI
jgi:hypothetical protein